jgi:hypothetical protein
MGRHERSLPVAASRDGVESAARLKSSAWLQFSRSAGVDLRGDGASRKRPGHPAIGVHGQAAQRSWKLGIADMAERAGDAQGSRFPKSAVRFRLRSAATQRIEWLSIPMKREPVSAAPAAHKRGGRGRHKAGAGGRCVVPCPRPFPSTARPSRRCGRWRTVR